MNFIFSKVHYLLKKNILSRDSFNLSNPLGGGGERVDIDLSKMNIDFNELDIYQKSHISRYYFALSYVTEHSNCADLACGTGYGSYLLSKKANKVIGVDLNKRVIKKIKKRYRFKKNLFFYQGDLRSIPIKEKYDFIVSFETLEHFHEEEIIKILKSFNSLLCREGKLIFSTPYIQSKTTNAINLGFHKTFNIDENLIRCWLSASSFTSVDILYQNYFSHEVSRNIEKKDFLVCVAQKNGNC